MLFVQMFLFPFPIEFLDDSSATSEDLPDFQLTQWPH